MAFSAGCLLAAFSELPRHEEGRTTIALFALVLGLVLPTAALQLSLALGLPGSAGIGGALDHVRASSPYLATAQLAAVPSLLLIRFILTVAHLRLAWTLLERDWPGVRRAAALIAAASGTLIFYAG